MFDRKAYDKAWYKKHRERRKDQIKLSVYNRRKRIRDKVFDYLKSHSCIDCGEKDFAVLEFDHLRDKSTTISVMMNSCFSWDKVMIEIAKCEVVCANCHRRRTYKRQNSSRVL